MANDMHTDVLVFGGGVAGLWLLGRLRRAGYAALLLESARLGEGQTRFAQGIIHGGTKYALQGALTPSAKAVAEMPARWRACLAGDGDPDLRGVQVLSQHHYLWSSGSLAARMSGFLASHAMRARSRPLAGDQRPAVFRHAAFRGQVYELDEPVIDSASLVRTLAEPLAPCIRQLPGTWHLRAGSDGVILETGQGGGAAIHAQAAVLSAGAGNAALLARLGRPEPQMQRRGLHMVLARGPLPEVFAHRLGRGATPRVTITTHPGADGDAVWYVGGQLAEEGVGRSRDAQIEAARGELRELLPWVDLAATRWTTLSIDRAEPRQPGGARPVDGFAQWDRRVVTVWPTKLALAPLVAERVLHLLGAQDVRPRACGTAPAGPHPGYAPPPWDEDLSWS